MKLQVISDCHLEFDNDKGSYFATNLPVLADTLIIAGDWGTYVNIVRTLEIICKRFKDVIYVCGNHEYYSAGNRGQIHNKLKRVIHKHPNLHWLNAKRVLTLNGRRFIGATMWFPFRDDYYLFAGRLNDFRFIPSFSKWVFVENVRHVDFLKTNTKEGDIVVTHYLPHANSVAEIYKTDKTNMFFLCDQWELIADKKPELWIHGHTHCSFDYIFEDTRIVCNPRGYAPDDLNRQFSAGKVIEV